MFKDPVIDKDMKASGRMAQERYYNNKFITKKKKSDSKILDRLKSKKGC